MARDFGARVQTVGEQVEVQVREGQVRPVLEAALEAGAEILSVTPNRISLEHVFLEAVERGEAAEAGPGSEAEPAP